ncbi:MAG: hypothetical protein IJG37_06550 [Synergistaceae bacterium]|nr:hypothetical protein [Synergistaceae bacterium]MBQ7170160.1 hypothetical protein [Synergistaceae bacterium]
MNTDTDSELPIVDPQVMQNDDADDDEFKSLKGIAGKRLDIDEVRKERLKL